MPEKCADNPRDCPISARVDRMEKEFDRYRDNSGKTHQEMFQRLNALEQSNTATQAKLDAMDGKLDKLVAWREEQDDKPNKLLDNLKNNAVWMVLAAVLGVVLGRLGL